MATQHFVTSKPDRLHDLLDAADNPSLNDEADFVASALRAAQASRGKTRPSILKDVAKMLGCEASDLNFLFHDAVHSANDAGPVHVPDYRAALNGYGLAAAE